MGLRSWYWAGTGAYRDRGRGAVGGRGGLWGVTLRGLQGLTGGYGGYRAGALQGTGGACGGGAQKRGGGGGGGFPESYPIETRHLFDVPAHPRDPQPLPGEAPWKALFGAARDMCLPSIGVANPCLGGF
jgi:hypothetical protein